jgi:hypothetical protein
MRNIKVIVSADQNPLYINFWMPVSRTWRKMGFDPVLLKIGERDIEWEDEYGYVKEFRSVDGYNTGLQAQVLRLYGTQFFSNDVCLISDIDMLPLNAEYFSAKKHMAEDDKLISFSTDAYPNLLRYPMCYNMAKGKVFEEIMNLNVSFSQFMDRLSKYSSSWYTDELYLFESLKTYDQKKVVKLERGFFKGIASKRVDRSQWKYLRNDVRDGNYIDSHLLRPYDMHREEIEKLIDCII